MTAAFSLAAGFAFGSRETLTPDTATCHNELLERQGGYVVGLLGRDPIDACTEVWRGAFGEPAPTALVVCVIDEGATGVYPNPDGMSPAEACSSIGADVFEPKPETP